MNQILNTKKDKSIFKKLFKIQLIISLILILVLVIIIFKRIKEKETEVRISQAITLNAKMNFVFQENTSIYFGKLIIDKIKLDSYVYNYYTEDLLKILPCKFSGESLQANDNICIIGHNYYDDRFFSNLNKLENGDAIIIEDFNGNKYKYTIYNSYEINENNIEEAIKIEQNRKILTLCTCTLDKNKRLIIKAKR